MVSYARNLRNELKKSKRVYFNDCFAERAKWRLVHEPETREFFRRTAQQQEVDLVEESAMGLKAFEFKWQGKKGKAKLPLTFRNAYPTATCETVTPDNAMGFRR